jgi:serine/threonine protein kinase
MDDILHRMLCLDAKKRITVEDALAHPFLKEVRAEH